MIILSSVLESLFNEFIGLQACNFTKKRLQHRRFPANFANFKNTYFEKHLQTADSDSSYILHRKLNKIIQEPDCPCRLDFCFFLKHKITLFYFLSYAFTRFITRCHSLSLIVIFCYSLSFVVSCCTTRCHSLNHSLPFVVPLDVTLCHSLSFVVPLVFIRCHSLSFDATRCTTLLSFYKRLLFHKFLLFTSFIIKTKTKKILSLKFQGDNYLKIK